MSNHASLPAIYEQLATRAADLARRGDERRAARFYRQAGRQAQAAGARAEAVMLFSHALQHTPDSALADRFELLIERERLLGLLGRTEAQARDLAALEALAERLGEDGQRARIATRQAAWRLSSGDLSAAVTIGQLAARLAQRHDRPDVAAEACTVWGHALLRQGDYPGAARRLEQALSLARVSADRALQADAARLLGALSNEQGRYAAARAHYAVAADLYRQLGDRQGQAQVLVNVGHTHQAQGEIVAARSVWEEARAILGENGDFEGRLRVLINLGVASGDVGQYEAALSYHESALEQAQAAGLGLGELFARLNLGLIYHYLGANESAVAHLQTALDLGQQMGSRRLQAHALSVLGHVLVELDRPAEAGDAYWEALAIWHELELPNLAAETRAGLARAAYRQGNLSLALWFVEEILTQTTAAPALTGAEQPVRIYLTCFEILDAHGDRRASACLQAGAGLLQASVDRIADDSLRHSLLHNIPAHQRLQALLVPA